MVHFLPTDMRFKGFHKSLKRDESKKEKKMLHANTIIGFQRW